MDFFVILRLSLKGLWIRKVRSFLTMLGIIIGTASVITILSVGSGAESLLTGALAKVGTKTIAVISGAADDNGPPAAAQGIVTQTLTYDDSEKLRELPHIEAVSPLVLGTVELSTRNRSIATDAYGVSADYIVISDYQPRLGRFLLDEEMENLERVVVLGALVHEELYPSGANPVGDTIRLNNLSFRIIGVMEKQGSQAFASADDIVYIPTLTAQKLLFGIDYLFGIRLRVSDESLVNQTKDRIRKRLRDLHNIRPDETDDFSVRSVSQALDIVKGLTTGIQLFLAFIAGISLVVGGIGIMNIMLMNVTQRTKEIGLRKALGATPQLIAMQFLYESIIVSLLGGIIGIILGISISYAVSVVAVNMEYEWVFSVPVYSVVLGLVVSASIGILFGWGPAKKASKLDPIEALRYE
jgi:putative ABC transport system permease protein